MNQAKISAPQLTNTGFYFKMDADRHGSTRQQSSLI